MLQTALLYFSTRSTTAINCAEIDNFVTNLLFRDIFMTPWLQVKSSIFSSWKNAWSHDWKVKIQIYIQASDYFGSLWVALETQRVVVGGLISCLKKYKYYFTTNLGQMKNQRTHFFAPQIKPQEMKFYSKNFLDKQSLQNRTSCRKRNQH